MILLFLVVCYLFVCCCCYLHPSLLTSHPSRNTIDRSVLNRARPPVPMGYDYPKNHQSSNIYVGGADSDEDTPKCYQVTNSNSNSSSSSNAKKLVANLKKPAGGEGQTAKWGGAASGRGGKGSVDFADDEHVYEMEPSLYEEEDVGGSGLGDDGSIYENTDFPKRESLTRKSSSPAVLDSSGVERVKKPVFITANRPQSISEVLSEGSSKGVSSPSLTTAAKRRSHHTHEDYEDPDAALEAAENCDYVDMDSSSTHNTYIDPGDLKRVSSSCSSNTTAASSSSSSTPSNICNSSSTTGNVRNNSVGGSRKGSESTTTPTTGASSA